MKIYFSGSIRGGRDEASYYAGIIKLLSDYGEVVTAYIGDEKLSVMGESGITEQAIYQRDMQLLLGSKALVAEVTTPSLGVGYEIALAEQHGKKLLCLYRPQEGIKLSAMILGNAALTVKEYNSMEDVRIILDEFFG